MKDKTLKKNEKKVLDEKEKTKLIFIDSFYNNINLLFEEEALSFLIKNIYYGLKINSFLKNNNFITDFFFNNIILSGYELKNLIKKKNSSEVKEIKSIGDFNNLIKYFSKDSSNFNKASFNLGKKILFYERIIINKNLFFEIINKDYFYKKPQTLLLNNFFQENNQDLGEEFIIIKNDDYHLINELFFLPKKLLVNIVKRKNILKEVFLIKNNNIFLISWFSNNTKKYYKMLSANDWPTFFISSTLMHKRISLSPAFQLKKKMLLLKPKGNVLDTCAGLGYSAIGASLRKETRKVYTFEKDINSIIMALFNPYSRTLFINTKISYFYDDIFKGIKKFPKNFFDNISHDPPKHQYAPLLYSSIFYKELFRTLKPGGIIFHYSYPLRTKANKIFFNNKKKKLEDIGFKFLFFDNESSGFYLKKPDDKNK